jgi:signal transduction histidine kinase
MLAEPPSAAGLQALTTALRQVFLADVAVLRSGELPPREAISPHGTDVLAWNDQLEAPASGSHDTPATNVLDLQEDASGLNVARVVVIPVNANGSRGTLWLGFGKKTSFTRDDLLMFDLIGDYVGLALKHSASQPAAELTTESTDDIVSQAAHDLRTPLTPISMLLQTLERKAAVGTVDLDSIARARRQVQRLTDMVSDLVDLSRLRENRLVLEPVVMDLRTVFQRGAKTFGERERRRTIELEVGDDPLWIVGDNDRTAHVMTSLFDHVARLVQGESPIRARLGRENSHVVLTIESSRAPTTSGIQLATHSARTHRVPPLGLGVRLADALFTRLGAKMAITTSRDGGAQIEARFPVAQAPGEKTAG